MKQNIWTIPRIMLHSDSTTTPTLRRDSVTTGIWHSPSANCELKELDDPVPGAAVIEVYQLEKRKEYLDYIHTAQSISWRGRIAWRTAL